jgi:hypothetical protein
VESCSFNLADIPLAKAYRRCFLNYVKATSHNPFRREELERSEFGALPLSMREHIARLLLDMAPSAESEAKRMFYVALFSVMAHDCAVSLAKRQHAPVAYRQCCACGTPSEDLWFPKGGVLPEGSGYCSWSCWQERPPPLLELERTIGVDLGGLLQSLPFPHGQKSRLNFALHLARWLLGDIAVQ